MEQEEILLISVATPRARVGSAIGDFMRERNSKKAKFGLIFEVFQNFPKPTGAHPKVTRGFPGGHFQFKIGIFEKSEKLCFWPSGPSPGVSGGLPGSLDLPSRAAGVSPGVPGNLLTWCEALFLQLPLPGGHKWTERNL